MKEFKTYLPGLRIIKTVLSVLLCLLFFNLFGHSKPIYAGIACILMMKETYDQTWTAGFNRVLGTLIGGSVSYIVLLFIQNFPFLIDTYLMSVILSTAVLVSLMICKWFHCDSYVYAMAGVITLITLLSYQDSYNNALRYVVIRILETIIGIYIAFFVNKYVNFGTAMNGVSKHDS